MRKIILLLMILIAGCSYKFIPSDLEYVELQESTDIYDWDKGIFTKNISIDFTKNDSSEDIRKTLTTMVNDKGLQLGIYRREENCTKNNFEPGFIELRYKRGTIVIEEDFCNNDTKNILYYEIKDLLKSINFFDNHSLNIQH